MQKIKEVLSVVAWLYLAPLIVATAVIATGGEFTIMDFEMGFIGQVLGMAFYLFSLESGVLITGIFIYGIWSGRLFEGKQG